MPKNEQLPPKLADWAQARARFRLSHAVVQMARELGMNPRRLGGKANHDQQPWKAPLPVFIADLYEKRFGRRSPEVVLSLEDAWRASKAKAAEHRGARAARRAEARASEVDRAHGFSVVGELSLEDGTTTLVEGDLAHRLSDALLAVMKPDLRYPPKANELNLLRAGLDVGAEVWNATLDEDEVRRAQTLLDIARRIEPAVHRGPVEARLRFVIDIADRKRALFPDDDRHVTAVNVEPRGTDVLITAASRAFRPRKAQEGAR